jgi:3-oxoadipate enol-lactonase
MLLPLQGRAIAYDLIGPETAPVICMTHSLSSDGGMWAEQIPPLLAAGFRVLRIDMRGHGGSDPVAGNYTMAELADDVALVLDVLAIPKVHYIGLSIGGMLGQGFAIRHPARVLSAMWCDTLPQTPPGGAQVWADRMAAVHAAGSLAPMADTTLERWFTDAFKPRRPGRWREMRDTVAATTPAGYLGCSAAISNYDWTGDLPKLKLPVLVVCGDQDPGTPPEGNKRIAALVPGGRYEEIAGAKHFPNIEQDAVFNRIMMDWFQARRSDGV